MNPNDEELLSAYLDGEVTAEEQARVERRLAEDAGYRQLHDDLRALRQHLEALPPHRLPADFAQSVLSAAERQMVAPQRAEAELQESKSAAADQEAEVEPWKRRLIRPLAWSGLIVAAAVLVMIFSQPEQRPGPLARQDEPAQKPPAPLEPRVVAKAPTPAKQAEMRAVGEQSEFPAADAAVKDAAGNAEVGKDSFGQPGAAAGLQQEAQSLDDSERQRKGAERQFKSAPRGQQGPQTADQADSDRRGSIGLKQGGRSPAGSPGAGAPAVRPTARGEAKSLLEGTVPFAPPAPAAAPVPEDHALPQSENAHREFETESPGVLGGAIRSPADEVAPPSAFDKAKNLESAPRTAPAELSLSVHVSPATAQSGAFERLLVQVQKPEEVQKNESKRDPAQSAAAQGDQVSRSKQIAKAEQAQATLELSKSVPASAELAKKELDVPAQQVFQVELTRPAMIELLAQLRSQPSAYRFDEVPVALAQEVNRRADELVAQRSKEKSDAHKLAELKAETLRADGQHLQSGQAADKRTAGAQSPAEPAVSPSSPPGDVKNFRAERSPPAASMPTLPQSAPSEKPSAGFAGKLADGKNQQAQERLRDAKQRRSCLTMSPQRWAERSSACGSYCTAHQRRPPLATSQRRQRHPRPSAG